MIAVSVLYTLRRLSKVGGPETAVAHRGMAHPIASAVHELTVDCKQSCHSLQHWAVVINHSISSRQQGLQLVVSEATNLAPWSCGKSLFHEICWLWIL